MIEIWLFLGKKRTWRDLSIFPVCTLMWSGVQATATKLGTMSLWTGLVWTGSSSFLSVEG